MMWINSYGLIAHVAVEKELKRVLIRQNVTYWLIEGADLKTCSPVSKLCWPPLCWCQPTDARSSLRSSREKELHVNQAWLMRSLGDQGESRREVLQDEGWWAEGVLGDEWAGSGRQNLADMPDSDPVPWAARSSRCFIAVALLTMKSKQVNSIQKRRVWGAFSQRMHWRFIWEDVPPMYKTYNETSKCYFSIIFISANGWQFLPFTIKQLVSD